MTAQRTHLRSPWLAPIALVCAIAVALLAQPLFAAGDSSDLPELSAEQLVARVLEAEPQALSGTVVHTANLGLPELPFGESAGAGPTSLLSGSSTIKLWTDGKLRSRVALHGKLSEWSVVANGSDVWTYSSSDNEAVHYRLSDADRARLQKMGAAAREKALAKKAELPTPQEVAAAVLGNVDEHSTVTVDTQTRIAGRDAYQLIVTPDTDATLVKRVVLGIDGQTMTPLRVRIWSTRDASEPAIDISFTDVNFAMPDESVFDFSPPAAATTRDVVVPLPEEATAPEPGGSQHGKAVNSDHEKPVVTGAGWETVVEFPRLDDADLGATTAPSGEGPDLLKQLTTKVPEGRLFSSALLSVLITNDGRVLVGAVPAETLRSMA